MKQFSELSDMENAITTSNTAIPNGYAQWREEIEKLIEHSKLQAVFHVNKELLSLYWQIGSDILSKQKMYGWGAQVIARPSALH